ncbi:SGNH/GDSL hydrolase family protein [Providencia rettgeri]
MKKIGDVTNTADKNGEFTNGNISTGTPPTILEGPWLTAIQREILNVLVKAGVVQDPNKDNQLAISIEKIAKSSVPELVQETGDKDDVSMSQKAITDAISDSQVNVPDATTEVKGKVKLADTVGESEELVLHQKASSLLFNEQKQNTNKVNQLVDSTLGGLLQFSQQVQNQITSNTWNLRHAVILGDSISHGANALDIYKNSWVSHLKRMFNSSYGVNAWGFISIKDQIGSVVGINQERHKVTLNGWNVHVNENASHTVNGAYATTSAINSELTIKIPPTCRLFRVWYTKQVGGGTFTITRDGVVLNTVDTSIANGDKQGWFWVVNNNATCNPNDAGVCTISIKNTTDGKPVEILGVSYANDFTAIQVNNFSQAGRKLIHVDDVVLEKVITGANPFILALGHNDRDDIDNEIFSSKINKIIQISTEKKVRVIIADFCWDKSIDNHVRSELKRCAESIPDAVWLPFPQWLQPGSDGAAASYYLQILKFTSDGSHPTPEGHKRIAEAVAKAIGLSVASVENALDKNFVPFDLTSSDLVNSVVARYEYYAGYRVEPFGVSIRGTLRKPGASKVPAGTYILGALDGVFMPSLITIPLSHESYTEPNSEQFVISISAGPNPSVKLIVPTSYNGSTLQINAYVTRNID